MNFLAHALLAGESPALVVGGVVGDWIKGPLPAGLPVRLEALLSTFAPPDAEVFGLQGADRDWLNRRQTPQPFSVYQQVLHFDAARVAAVPRTFIDCTSPALATIAPSRQRVRSEPGWQVMELATGHDPMVSEPQALADLLLGIHGQLA